MREDYFNYMDDSNLIRTYMMPAVQKSFDLNNMQSMVNQNENVNQTNFLNPSEGFLKGNIESNKYEPHKNMTYIKPNITNERDMMLYKVQEMCFMAHDINLYLDTHPNDSYAINLYNKYNNDAKKLTDEYEKRYGPIDLSDDSGLNMTPWSWINEPWPWNE